MGGSSKGGDSPLDDRVSGVSLDRRAVKEHTFQDACVCALCMRYVCVMYVCVCALCMCVRRIEDV